MPAKNNTSEETFESAMKKLEEIADKLEQGDISLDESMDLFAQGIELTKYCNKKITQIEQQINLLVKDAQGNTHEVEFEE